MRLYRFGKERGKMITHFDSNFIMSPIIHTDKSAHVGGMYLDANGVIGRHQAVCAQLLLVVAGSGWVTGNSEERVYVETGDAVFWEHGEWHETESAAGLTAIVIESDQLTPAQFMSERE